MAINRNEFYKRCNDYIDGLRKTYNPTIFQEVLRELYRVQDIAANYTGPSWVGTSQEWGYKWLLFKDLAEDALDAYFHTSVQAEATSLVSWFQNSVDTAFKGFTSDVTENAAESLGSISDVTEQTLQALAEQLEIVGDVGADVQEKVADTYSTLTQQNQELNDTVTTYLMNLYSGVQTNIEFEHDALLTSIETLLNDNLGKLDSYYQYTGEQSKQFSEEGLSQIVDLGNLAKESLDTTSSETLESIKEYSEVVQTESEKTYSLFGQLFSAFTEQTITPLSELVDTKNQLLGIPATDANRSAAGQVHDVFQLMFRELSAAVGGVDDVENAIEKATDKGSILATLMATVMYTISNAMLCVSAISVSNTSRLQKFAQDVASNDPVSDFSLSEAAGLRARGFIDDDEAHRAALKQGYLYSKTDAMTEASKTPLSLQDSVAALRRGYIDGARWFANLRRLGYDPEDGLVLDQLAEVLPALDDLIRMAVREVFSPDVASEFELFSDLPQEFVDEAAKQGLSRDWAEKYWGAHWQLPSASQGFEMFHRGLIDEETLDTLIRALDVSPIWRQPLKGITYNLITRVDLRRIYQMGLIDAVEVESRFVQMGYHPDDAALLTKFYVAYAGDDPEAEPLSPKELNVTMVKNLYELGTYSKAQAVEALISIDYDADLAAIYVQYWEDNRLYEERADLINRYTRRAIREDMNDQEVEALVYELNLTADELRRVKRVVESERSEFDTLPSKTELNKLATSGIITFEQWYTYMRRHGYSDEIIGWYSTLYLGK